MLPFLFFSSFDEKSGKRGKNRSVPIYWKCTRASLTLFRGFLIMVRVASSEVVFDDRIVHKSG